MCRNTSAVANMGVISGFLRSVHFNFPVLKIESSLRGWESLIFCSTLSFLLFSKSLGGLISFFRKVEWLMALAAVGCVITASAQMLVSVCTCCMMSSWEELSKARLRVHSDGSRRWVLCSVGVSNQAKDYWRIVCEGTSGCEGTVLPPRHTNHWALCVCVGQPCSWTDTPLLLAATASCSDTQSNQMNALKNSVMRVPSQFANARRQHDSQSPVICS